MASIIFLTLQVLAYPLTAASEASPVTPLEGQYTYRDTQFRMFPRRYAALEPAEVTHACEANIRAAVRFQDTFKSPADKADTFRRIGFQIYIAGEVLETGSGLLVAIPHLHYTPWLDEPLRRAKEMKTGESFVVEGISAGTCRGMPLVYADRILTPGEQASTVQFEFTLQGSEEIPAIVIDTASRRTVSVPISATRSVDITATVEQVPRPEILAWWKSLLLGTEPPQASLRYQPLEGDEWASAEPGTDVRCEGRVEVIGIPPENLGEVETPAGITIQNGAYALVDNKIVCLIPAGEAFLVERAARILPGQDVVVEGTILAHPDEERVLMVHDIRFADIPTRPEVVDEWRLMLTGESLHPRSFYMPGEYRLGYPARESGTDFEIRATLRESRRPGH